MDKSSALRAQRLGMSAAEIRQLRRRMDWTQARLALVLGLHRMTLGRWECDTGAAVAPAEADHGN